MASEMVERVGKALFYDVVTGIPNADWDTEKQDIRDHYLDMARTAIGEMREPTDWMGGQGSRVRVSEESVDHHMALSEAERQAIGFGDMFAGNPCRWAKPMWRAMVDAALADAPPALASSKEIPHDRP